ncbi:MAG: hypothetical protein U0L91_07290 [Gemmiger sp.]|uniref:hypothetical protein n=1 Tax=Gemmiger sp. TaxID=2049027 RepID=UPI002E759E79|nr:hypothetical protein [Gemmiger sp.]MEE0801067.1 hypothetical protein [Gemmiger sp.]
MQIAFGLLFILFFSAVCLCVAACTNYDAAALPLPVLSGAVVVLYLFGLLGPLQYGRFAVFAILLACGVYFGVRAGARAIRRAARSPGFLLFVGGACFLWLLLGILQPMFTQWDEFTAWGLAPKMVAERACLYVADPVNLTASFTYPGTSLVSFLFQFPGAPFSEWACLASLDILALACLAPAASLPRSRWATAVPIFAAGFLLPFFFSVLPAGTPSTVYRSAMADTPLAMLFGGTVCLYRAVGGRRSGYAACALPLAVLTMTKDMGFAYALMAAFLILADRAAGFRPARRRPLRLLGCAALRIAVPVVPVLAVFLSWNRYTAAVTPTADTAAAVGSEGLSYGAVLAGGLRQLAGLDRQPRFAQIMGAMARALVERRVCLLGAPAVALVCIALLYGAAALASPRGVQRRRVVTEFVAGAFCFAALYAFHLILYYYNFSEAEGNALKDYERYLSPYLIGWMLAGLCVLGRAACVSDSARARLGRAASALACAAVLLVFAWRGIPASGFWSDDNSLYTLRADVKARAACMNTVLDWPDRVLVISQGDDATRWYYYKYELTAKVVNGYGGTWWGNDDYSSRWDSDFMNLVESLNWDLYDFEAVCTVDSLTAYMEEKNIGYLLIDRADDYLEREFSSRFEGGLTADMPATLYRFEGRNAPIAFTPVARAESGVES